MNSFFWSGHKNSTTKQLITSISGFRGTRGPILLGQTILLYTGSATEEDEWRVQSFDMMFSCLKFTLENCTAKLANGASTNPRGIGSAFMILHRVACSLKTVGWTHLCTWSVLRTSDALVLVNQQNVSSATGQCKGAHGFCI